ncbi:MAG: hypothetical protein HYS07_07885 [Chlamydiae bacterium]|nr:hypothetical protein [Chlamydiota bacterium]MBI3278056.1 hypothetical protein [Chlamydiota bacterium]
MIIWSGLGFLVAVITFAMLVLTELGAKAMFNLSYYQDHGWPKMFAFVVSGVMVWVLGRFLSKKPGRVVIDKGTGKELELKKGHSLFFIKMEYWGPILIVIGMVLLFVKL